MNADDKQKADPATKPEGNEAEPDQNKANDEQNEDKRPDDGKV